jgi:dehydrogenase/reductase SDR family member 7B
MSNLKNKVVIITGSSGGIGRGLAIKFASEGNHVVINGRDKDKLDELSSFLKSKGYSFIAVPGDVSRPEDCENIINATIEKFDRIDILINNAGISMRAVLAELDTTVIDKVMSINFWGTVYCTQYAIPHLIKSKGSVVGISSVAGKKGLPGRTGYSASKFAMEGFLEALRIENIKNKLHVLIVNPGFTASNIRKSALNSKGEVQEESPRDEKNMMTAEEVALKIFNAVSKRKRDLVLTSLGKLIVLVDKIYPSLVDRIIFRQMSKEPGSPF